MAREAGLLLGDLFLSEAEWSRIAMRPVYTIRLDDHAETDGWKTSGPNGSEYVVEFEIPLHPKQVPHDALQHDRAFSEWVQSTHGARGCLLVWDDTQRWWIVNEPDLEVTISCVPDGLLDVETDAPFSWIPNLTEVGRQRAADIMALYKLG